ncbi:MAG: hypothetical protein R2795_09430 [Saprospiraceae bacterium]
MAVVTFHVTETLLDAPLDCGVSGYLAIYRIEIEAIDLCGNATSVTFDVKIVDETKLVFLALESNIGVAGAAKIG